MTRPAAKEVSCLALTFFYDYLERRHIPRAALQQGLRHSPEHLDGRTNWIDYPTFLEIERRMQALCPEPGLFFDIGRTFAQTSGFGFLRVIFRSVVSPYQLYRLLPRVVKRFLFPFVEIHFERLDASHFRGVYTFDPGYPASDAFFDTVRGILTGAPTMLGLPQAEVRWRRTSPLQAIFDVALPRQVGWGPRLTGAGRRTVQTLRLWLSNFGDAGTELETANRLLQEKVDDLTDAKAQLHRKLAELSLLNALAQAGTAELDPRLLLQKVVALLSRELGGIAAGIFLPEGEPPSFVVGAAQGLSLPEQERLCEAPALARTLEGEGGEVTFGDASFHLLPMESRDRVVGTLVLKGPAGRLDAGFQRALAGGAAVLIDNAIAFQTIADLRDNLEQRVRERTAELDEARGALERTVGQLQRSDRARNEFFTNVSHELRTPLTLILAPLDNLEAQLSRAQLPPEDVRLIRRNAQVLLRQIDEVLDFARLDAERLPLRPEPFDLAELASELLAAIRPSAERRRLRLLASLERPLPVRLDPGLIRRVLLNLLGNAVKYVEEGGTLRLSIASEEGGRVRLSVEDDGPGIPLAQQQRIFERFQRVLDSRGRAIEGSGLGLAMVKEIVQLHQGALELRSAPGEGATFTATLPREVEGEAAAPAPLRSEELGQLLAPLEAQVGGVPEQEDAWAGRDTRVLLVEDNDEMRTFLARLLGARFEVLTASSGEEGLALARREAPDAVVSDVMMGGLDGYGLCQRLKEDTGTRMIPVLLISARHGADAALEGFRAGAADYIVKPFSAPELLARVEAQIRIRRMGLALVRLEKQTTLGLLSSGIAHEVLNPINAVVNAVAPLREALHEGSQELGEELLSVVERAGDRVQSIVRSLLSFARQDVVRPREVPLGELVDSVLTILQFRLDGRVRVHRELQWTGAVSCVPELLGQVLMNLLTNALDALPQEGGNLWIRSRREGGVVRLSVKDDGPGVSPKLRERIFDAFFTTKPPGSGTGLGLAVSREVMAMHGGTLELAPPGPAGAELVLTLPVAARARNNPEVEVLH